MKNGIYLLLCFVFVCEFCCAQNKAWSSSIKSGYVEYNITGNTTGKRFLWWDNYGRKMRMEEKSVTVVKLMGISSKDEKDLVTVIIDGEFWVADLVTKTGYKGKLQDYEKVIKFYEDMTKEEIKMLEEELKNTFGGEKIGAGKVLGKDCDIFSVMGSKTWIYKGMSLRTEIDVMGIKTNEIATIFKTNIPTPSARFEYVKGIEYKEMAKFEQGMYANSDFDDDDDIENFNNTYKVNYSFLKFKSAADNFEYGNYRKVMVRSRNGQYVATYMKGFGGMLIVTAASNAYTREAYNCEFERFQYNGFKCRFCEDDGSVLIISYPKYKMDVIITNSTYIEKEEMLKIFDKFKF